MFTAYSLPSVFSTVLVRIKQVKHTQHFKIWLALAQFLIHWGILVAYSGKLQSSNLVCCSWQFLYHLIPTENLTFSCVVNTLLALTLR